MRTRQKALAAIALAFTIVSPTWAQVRCTMPNQKVITFQTASKCPVDALKAETLDGKDITPPASERPASAAKPVSPPKPVAAKPIENHIVHPRREERVEPFDAARVICDHIKEKKAGLCSIDQESRMGRGPSIRIVTDGSVENLRQFCELISKQAYDLSKGSLRERYWVVKVFSRHDIFTPVASCNI